MGEELMLRYLRNIVVLAGAIAMAGCNGCGPGGPGPGGNDDRPPIIVSDGSVLLRVVAKDRRTGTNEKRGQWNNGSGKWIADHPDNDLTKMLTVSVIYGKYKASTTCDNPETNYEVRYVEFVYGAGKILKVYIDAPNVNAPGPVTLEFDGVATKDPKIPFWLKVGDPGDRLVSVKVGGFECELEPGLGQVHIYQHRQ
jgi:hypothetical protein